MPGASVCLRLRLRLLWVSGPSGQVRLSATTRRRQSAMPVRRGFGATADPGRFHEPGIHHGSYTPGRNYAAFVLYRNFNR